MDSDAHLSICEGPSHPPLLEQTVGQVLRAAVAIAAQREALVSPFQSVRYCYAELGREVDRAARALLALGVESGARIGICSTNRTEWVIAQHAIAAIGGIT